MLYINSYIEIVSYYANKVSEFKLLTLNKMICYIKCSNTIKCILNITEYSTKSKNEVGYVDRRNRHSINVQLMCEADMRIYNSVIKSPGSVHCTRFKVNCVYHICVLLKYNISESCYQYFLVNIFQNNKYIINVQKI